LRRGSSACFESARVSMIQYHPRDRGEGEEAAVVAMGRDKGSRRDWSGWVWRGLFCGKKYGQSAGKRASIGRVLRRRILERKSRSFRERERRESRDRRDEVTTHDKTGSKKEKFKEGR